MIDVYYWPTPNGWKVTIMLEECGLEYQIIPVDIGGGDQFKPEFLRLSPNNRMPAIIDHEADWRGRVPRLVRVRRDSRVLGGEERALSSAGCRRAVRDPAVGLLADGQPRAHDGNANHFKNYAKNLTDDPDQLVYGTNRFVGEVDRLSGVMDAQLSVNRYLAGDEYTIADIISWPWAKLLGRLIDENIWDGFPNLKRWVDEVGERPAVDKGCRAGRELGDVERTEEEEKARRELLFNQSNEKVRKARQTALQND